MNSSVGQNNLILLIALLLLGSFSFSQTLDESPDFAIGQTGMQQPFLFSVTTLTSGMQKWNLGYSSSYGERVNGPFGFDGIGQQFSIKGYLGNRFTLYGNAGLGISDEGKVSSAQRAEIIRDLIGGKNTLGFRLGIGLGGSHDYANVSALFSRLTLSFESLLWRLGGNMVFEKVFESNRDAIDITTSIGFQYQILRNLYAGVEAMGQDLEGFWEEDEAEGGARLLFGPSINYSPNHSRFMFSLCGGPVVYATHSTIVPEESDQDFPLENGFSVQAMIIFNLSGPPKI